MTQHTNSSSDGELYEVEAIVGSRQTEDGVEFLVQWKGYDSSQNTWEPREHLAGALHVLRAFESKQKQPCGGVDEQSAKKRKRLYAASVAHKQQATEESDSSDEQTATRYSAPCRKTEDLVVLSVRAARGDLMWTVQTRTGQKQELTLEQVKTRAPLTLIDYLISKLRFA